jgi:PAS domain S-box-containing protein
MSEVLDSFFSAAASGGNTEGRVMVVDDDQGFNNLVVKALGRAGFQPQGVLSGKQAREVLQADPDLVLVLDHRLPDTSGTELIKSLHADGYNPPFVAITGHGDEELAVELMKLGARDYLIKGFDIRDLLPEILRRVFREVETEKKLVHAEKKLLQSEREKALILESISNLVVFYDSPELKIKWANQAAADAAGISSEDLMGRHCYEIWGMRDGPCPGCPALQCFETGEWAQDREQTTPDGRIWRINAFPVRDDEGEFLGVVEVTRDITQQERSKEKLIQAKKEAEAANKAKSDFLANMSHELRTPMNGIKGMLQLLEDSEMDAEQRDFVHNALKSSDRLVNLLSDIVDLSRIEAGNIHIAEEPFQPREAAQVAEHLFRPACEQKGLELEFKVHSGVPDTLLGDSTRVQQVLNNLVGNAVKYTDKGRIEVEVCPAGQGDSKMQRLLFSVSDTGMGIEDDKVSYLFKPFTQADEGYTRKFQGAGLGLSIVSELVSAMGGTIAVDSEYGRGSTFYFSLPFKTLQEEKRTDKEPDVQETAAPSNHKVLLAEDDMINRTALTRILEKHDCAVRAVENGKEVLQALQEDVFDLVLMDVQMPIMDGVEATRAIRSGQSGIDPGIPIIAVTAHAMSGDEDKFLQAGMDGYLPKPVDMNQFYRILDRVMK